MGATKQIRLRRASATAGRRTAACLALLVPTLICGLAVAGPVHSRSAITNLTPGGPSRVVAAVRQGDDRLKLIVWDVTSDGGLTRRGDVLGDRITDVDVTALSTSRVATAVHKADGNLEVAVFDVSGSIWHRRLRVSRWVACRSPFGGFPPFPSPGGPK